MSYLFCRAFLSMRQIITEFSSSSVSSGKHWQYIPAITNHYLNNEYSLIIVCSTLLNASGTLEQIIDAALANQHQSLTNGDSSHD
ncbi:MAG: hypothetical protein ACOVQX_05190 [Legionella sp.]